LTIKKATIPMKIITLILVQAFFISSGEALSSSEINNVNTPSRLQTDSRLKTKNRYSTEYLTDDKSKCELCPESEMDRREAAFAMIGTMWSAGMIPSAVLGSPKPAEAVYGADANIEVPNVMDNMNNRVNQQCLVESLGNRECLVYLDPEKKIYQGPESEILVERLEAATEALAEIPSLVTEKKWSKVSTILLFSDVHSRIITFIL
jgi:hypothetical protein